MNNENLNSPFKKLPRGDVHQFLPCGGCWSRLHETTAEQIVERARRKGYYLPLDEVEQQLSELRYLLCKAEGEYD